MGHHFNHNPSLSMNKSTLDDFANRLGQKKGKNKIKRIDNLILNFNNYYLDHSPKHINRMILELKNNKGEMAEKTNKKLNNVFVPTTPNPTSGFLLMFPIDEVIYLNMTFEEASIIATNEIGI